MLARVACCLTRTHFAPCVACVHRSTATIPAGHQDHLRAPRRARALGGRTARARDADRRGGGAGDCRQAAAQGRRLHYEHHNSGRRFPCACRCSCCSGGRRHVKPPALVASGHSQVTLACHDRGCCGFVCQYYLPPPSCLLLSPPASNLSIILCLCEQVQLASLSRSHSSPIPSRCNADCS